MNKISSRIIWFLVSVLWAGIEVAEIAIRSKLQVDTPLGLFLFEITQFSGVPSQVVFAWYFSIVVLINVIFLTCLWQLTRPSLRPLRIWVLLTVQLLIVLLNMSELSLILTVELMVFLNWKQAWICLALKFFLYASLECYFLNRTGTPFNFAMLANVVFFRVVFHHVLPFIAGYLILKEKRTRLQLMTALRDLEANQALLMESVREEERLRIEANLRDAVGHQLTALNLHLDLAERHALENRSDEVQSALEIARDSASLLLSKVRTTTRVFV